MDPAPATSTAPSLPIEAQGRGRGRYGWLGGWRLLAVGAVVVALAVLAFNGAGAAERLLPLLFVLPCAAMMVMCMRHAGGHRQDTDRLGADAGSPADGR